MKISIRLFAMQCNAVESTYFEWEIVNEGAVRVDKAFDISFAVVTLGLDIHVIQPDPHRLCGDDVQSIWHVSACQFRVHGENRTGLWLRSGWGGGQTSSSN